MVKKIWIDDDYQLEIVLLEKSEKQKEAMIALIIENQEYSEHFGMIQLDKTDVYELIEELKAWLEVLEQN